MTPAALLRLQTQFALMAMEANAVIWMRLWGMAGLWNVTRSEPTRMVREKQTAFAKASSAAAMAAMTGRDPASAALKPIRNRTRSNVRRLGKRGPKRP